MVPLKFKFCGLLINDPQTLENNFGVWGLIFILLSQKSGAA